MTQPSSVPQVAAAQVPDGALVLDVREDEEWQAGHIEGAVHIPLGQLSARYQEVGRDQELYVICRSGNRSNLAAQALAGAGWDARNIADGMQGWAAAGRPMTSQSGAPFVA